MGSRYQQEVIRRLVRINHHIFKDLTFKAFKFLMDRSVIAQLPPGSTVYKKG